MTAIGGAEMNVGGRGERAEGGEAQIPAGAQNRHKVLSYVVGGEEGQTLVCGTAIVAVGSYRNINT